MSYIILISLCAIILISYLFDITSRFSRIPGIILLIILGMALNYFFKVIGFVMPDLSALLPVMGTLGLVLIVLEGSLDLKIGREKRKLIASSLASAGLLFLLFAAGMALILSLGFGYDFKRAMINAIPLGVISSAVAIPSAVNLKRDDREFVVYESSMSDIIGIMVFDFILFSNDTLVKGLFVFSAEIVISVVISVVISALLAYLLHRTTHHIKYVMILTFVVLIYALAKIIHWPSLIVVLIFGLILNNNNLFRFEKIKRIVDFSEFNAGLKSFKQITGELTFLVRSFFFLIFGFYTSLDDLLNVKTLMVALSVSFAIFLLRGLFFRFVLKKDVTPLVWFAPRGLITILLFMSIPAGMSIPFINGGLVVQTIILTILIMTVGNIISGNQGEAAVEPNTNEPL